MSEIAFSKNNDGLYLAHIFFIAAIFTSSFDNLLVFNLGFNFRATQLLMVIPTLIATIKSFKYKGRFPVGFSWLLIWTLFIIAFVPNTIYLTKSLGYAAWLVFDVLMVYACVQIYSSQVRVLLLLRWYVYSFVFVAIFGLVQFVSPLMGLSDVFLVETWWIPGVFPRLNGFSYEPSFYATYLLMGWVLCAFLLESKSNLFKLSNLRWYFAFISLALFLSGSRMGILMMLVWYCQYPIRLVIRLMGGHINKRYALITIAVLASVLLSIGMVLYFLGLDEVLFLFGGLGMFGTASHSVDTRAGRMMETFLLFQNSPLIGYSLGGIAPAIAQLHGVTDLDFESVKEFEGNSIFVEVLAASGIFGFIPFFLFVWSIVWKPLALSKKLLSEQSKILVALSLSLIFEFVILQFNQVILRPYLWMHIAVLAACYSVFKLSGKFINFEKIE